MSVRQCPIGAILLKRIVIELQPVPEAHFAVAVQRIAREHTIMADDIVEVCARNARHRRDEAPAQPQERAAAINETIARLGTRHLDHVVIDETDPRVRFTHRMDAHLLLGAPRPDFTEAVSGAAYQQPETWMHEIRLSDGAYASWLTLDTLIDRYGDAVRCGWVPPIEIRPIDDATGSGVFLTDDIPCGTFIGAYTGVLHIPTEDERRQEKRRRFRAAAGRQSPSRDHDPYAFTYHPYGHRSAIEGACIRAGERGNHTRFINHGYPPNTDVARVLFDDRWHAIIVTNQDVKAGEQIVLDYGRSYWRSADRAPIALR